MTMQKLKYKLQHNTENDKREKKNGEMAFPVNKPQLQCRNPNPPLLKLRIVFFISLFTSNSKHFSFPFSFFFVFLKAYGINDDDEKNPNHLGATKKNSETAKMYGLLRRFRWKLRQWRTQAVDDFFVEFEGFGQIGGTEESDSFGRGRDFESGSALRSDRRLYRQVESSGRGFTDADRVLWIRRK